VRRHGTEPSSQVDSDRRGEVDQCSRLVVPPSQHSDFVSYHTTDCLIHHSVYTQSPPDTDDRTETARMSCTYESVRLRFVPFTVTHTV